MRINIVLLILSITASAVFAAENWQKIGNNFYFDVNSAKNNIHKYWRKHYPDGHLGIMHPEDDDWGELYFNTLCKF